MKEPLHPEETITSFCLIRHGHTKATEEGKLYTDPNAPLTEKGGEQARALASWLHKDAPDLILTSRAYRVRSTADIIAAATGHEALSVEGLDEWHVGDWEGKSYWEIRQSEPELYKRWSEDPIHNAPPGGESIGDLCKRVEGRVKELIASYRGKRIALVTHAGVVRAALIYALGVPVANFWRLSVPTGSASKVDFSDNFATVRFVALRPGMLPG